MPGKGPHGETGRAPGESGYKGGCRCDVCRAGHAAKRRRQRERTEPPANDRVIRRPALGRSPRPDNPPKPVTPTFPQRKPPGKPTRTDKPRVAPGRSPRPDNPGSVPLITQLARALSGPLPGVGTLGLPGPVSRSASHTEPPRAAPGRARRSTLRYSFGASKRGMCPAQIAGEPPCNKYIGPEADWLFTVDGNGVCKRHYDIVRNVYPGHCQYQLMGIWKNAPGAPGNI